jgi:hypothetical protein
MVECDDADSADYEWAPGRHQGSLIFPVFKLLSAATPIRNQTSGGQVSCDGASLHRPAPPPIEGGSEAPRAPSRCGLLAPGCGAPLPRGDRPKPPRGLGRRPEQSFGAWQ